MASQVVEQTVEIAPVSGAIGAEIRGVDLERLSDDQFAKIHALFLEHLVLVFPDQQLSIEGHIAFGRRFGELFVHPRQQPVPGYPELFVIEGDKAVADHWHTDSTFDERPPLASILKMVTCPHAGGDTMWSNQYLAYERLSSAMRAFLDRLTAIHTLTTEQQPSRGKPLTATHPVVRVHPETGRRSLFVNRSYTSGIAELSPGESEALLTYLYTWSEQPEFHCRYRWHAGAVAIWDNRCTQHCVVGDYNELRRIERVTPRGDVPRGCAD